MTEEEIKDLGRYFRLITYRDDGDMLLEEYEELETIIKNNNVAKELEAARYKCIMKKISEEEYNKKIMSYFKKWLQLTKTENNCQLTKRNQ